MNTKLDYYNKYLCKTLIIGDSGVGKSSIMTQFVDGIFQESYICTIGVDYKTISVDANEHVVKFLLWDTAGQEKFRSLCRNYYRGAQCAIFVFDLTKANSFHNIRQWLNDFEEETTRVKNGQIVKILVGNKADLKAKRTVSYKDALEFSETNGFVHYFETSAKENINIDEVFYKLGKEYVEVNPLTSISSNVNITQKPSRLGGLCTC